MARDPNVIIAEIRAARQAKPELSDLNGPTAAADFGLWEDVIGYSHYEVELECDALKAELNMEIANNSPGSISWWRTKILEFQFDAANPQVVEEIDFKAVYPVIDASLRIITRCAVRNVMLNDQLVVSVKVAKTVAGVDTTLTGPELDALIDYTLAIRPAGISMESVSLFPDRLKLVADIYYKGQYGQALIQSQVIQAVKDYLAYASSAVKQQFDGLIRLLTLEDFIQQTPGVTDIVIQQAYGRGQATPVGGSTLFTRVYYTLAGYMVVEDTPGHTLADTLNFIIDPA